MRILSALLDVILMPIDIVKDAATAGGILIDESKSATRQRIEKIEEELNL